MQELLEKASARAARRFKRVANEGVYTDPDARANRLWRQAERLQDALVAQMAFMTWIAGASEAAMGARVEADWLSMQDGDLPDVPLAAFVTESELRLMDGNR